MKLTKVFSILLTILLSLNSFAQNAQFITKGTPAPFDGNLLTIDQTKSLYNDSLEKSSLQKQLDLTNANVNLLQQDKILLLDQNGKLLKANQNEATLSDLEKVGCFLLGVAVTALAVKGAASLR